MIENLIIRAERPEDYHNTELMTMRSFWNKYFPGCVEHNMLRVVRASPDFLPQISRIAEVDGKIAGAVFYTKAWIVDEIDTTKRHEVAMLGPLAVEPTLEGNDIGGALLRETLRLAKEAGIPGILVAGEPEYYPKFGFKLCEDFGITDGEGNSYDAYLCYPLCEEFKSFKGHFEESPDFGKIDDEATLERINAEFPAYRKVQVQEDFMQIFNEHLGVVESVKDGVYMVRYWELLIPCSLSKELEEKPQVGSDVQFYWNHKAQGESQITRVIENLLENDAQKDELHIRPLDVSNVEMIKAFFADVFTNEPWNDDWSDKEQLHNYILDLTGQSYSLTLALFEGSTLVGLSMGHIKHWFMGTEYVIEEFCIARSKQHQGLGTKFMQKIEEYIGKFGLTHIFLQTERNVPAYEFYKKIGFTEIEGHVSLGKEVGSAR